jgi:hypothetical protein
LGSKNFAITEFHTRLLQFLESRPKNKRKQKGGSIGYWVPHRVSHVLLLPIVLQMEEEVKHVDHRSVAKFAAMGLFFN